MAYSTQTELENNVKLLEQTITDATARANLAAERIAFADKIVETDCSRFIDFSLVPDDETTPIVNILSQYKSAEMTLRRLVGIKRRTVQNDDIEEWKKMYDELKEKIMDNKIDVELSDGTIVNKSINRFSNTARPDIRPSQGYDKYGEWINNDDMEKVRGDTSWRRYRY